MDFTKGQTVYVGIGTRAAAGGVPSTITGSATYLVWKNGTLLGSQPAGITESLGPSGHKSLMNIAVDTSADAAWERGCHFVVLQQGVSIDGVSVEPSFQFGVEEGHEPGRIAVHKLAQAIASTTTQLAAGEVPTGTNTAFAWILKELATAQERELLTSDDTNDNVTHQAWNPTPGSPPRYNLYAAPPGITAADIVLAHFARTFHATKMSGRTYEELIAGIASVIMGLVSGLPGSPAIRNLGNTGDALTATTDANGNRSVVAFDPTQVR